jgi:hypothetical protein
LVLGLCPRAGRITCYLNHVILSLHCVRSKFVQGFLVICRQARLVRVEKERRFDYGLIVAEVRYALVDERDGIGIDGSTSASSPCQLTGLVGGGLSLVGRRRFLNRCESVASMNFGSAIHPKLFCWGSRRRCR